MHTQQPQTVYVSHQAPSFVRDLTLSCWNPPPGHRKLQGDFLYITVLTMEGRRFDITSCPKGFFLNRYGIFRIISSRNYLYLFLCLLFEYHNAIEYALLKPDKNKSATF